MVVALGDQLEHGAARSDEAFADLDRQLAAIVDELRRLTHAAADPRWPTRAREAGGARPDLDLAVPSRGGVGRTIAAIAQRLEITAAGQRATELTSQLLAFGRRQILQPRIIDLGIIVAGMEKMLRRIIEENVEPQTLTSPRLGKVRVDPGQIEQVIMNLVVNARDAMPNGGSLIIKTANLDITPDDAVPLLGVVAGPHVLLSVVDTGAGMDAATQARIFEPFFTTKPKGKGTGLGLATVFGIVQQSGGSVWVTSAPGQGTTFKR